MTQEWTELEQILQSQTPGADLQRAHARGDLARWLPEVDALWGVPQRADFHPEVDTGTHVCMVLDAARRLGADTAGMWAAMTHDVGKALTPAEDLPRHPMHEKRGIPVMEKIHARLQPPEDCVKLATLVEKEHGNMHACQAAGAKGLLKLLERCNALDDPQTFDKALLAAEADARGRGGDFPQSDYPQRAYLQQAASRLREVRDALQANLHEGAEGRSAQSLEQSLHKMLVNTAEQSVKSLPRAPEDAPS